MPLAFYIALAILIGYAAGVLSLQVMRHELDPRPLRHCPYCGKVLR